MRKPVLATGLVVALSCSLTNCLDANNNLKSSAMSECGVYLAPSTIPGAGIGMFAGRDYRPGDQVTYGDIIIPILELHWHNENDDFFWLWDEYTWSHNIEESMGYETEEHSGISAASPGIGAALNCMIGLVNVEDTWSKCDNAGLHRSRDPGAGAVTPYHGRGSLATRNITAGDELFIDYGDGYFESRAETYGLVPLSDDFVKADRIMYNFVRLQSHVLKYYSEELQQDLWSLISDFEDQRIFNALPDSLDDVDRILHKGTQLLHQDRSRHSLAWLQEHGQCVDNIRDGPSTIPQAGRGAFATRFIPKGGLVAPSPLIHITNRSKLVMYDVLPPDEKGYDIGRNESAPIHHQLLLNYCFGHPESTLLLSPYGVLVNLINHSPTPNTRIEWSKRMRHPEWLKMDPCDLESEDLHSGLSFDFVAIHDIAEGEEITVNYGRDWEAAWQEHLHTWTPPKDSEMYEAAYELNSVKVDSILPTMAEGGYSDNLKMWVHGAYVKMSGIPSQREYYRARILKRFEAGETVRYMAQVFTERDVAQVTMIRFEFVLFSLPRDAFVFDDVPYSRDHNQPWAFRHYIGIPDEIFPSVWKNAKTGQSCG